MTDLRALIHPKEAAWSGSGQAWLLDVYDWDIIIVNQNISASLSFELELCIRLFPCSLFITGRPSGTIQLEGIGYISCLISDGCEVLRLENIFFSCKNTQIENPPFKIQGSSFTSLNSTFAGCISSQDGGLIRSFNQSTVTISMSTFSNIRSYGFGGVIAAYGGSVYVSDSRFVGAFASQGGGAIWSSAYQSCYGFSSFFDTVLEIEGSVFTNCATNGNGGAILVVSDVSESDSNRESLGVEIKSSTFFSCQSSGQGGAIHLSGLSVSFSLSRSIMNNNTAQSGGAISATDGVSLAFNGSEIQNNTAFECGGAMAANNSEIALTNCTLKNNKALGFGGGALCFKETSLSVLITLFSGNQAPFGGGGVLLQTSLTNISWHEMRAVQEVFAAKHLCGENNYALYGSCVASDFWKLEVSDVIESVYAGLPFNFTVTKKDVYGNTILSDSSSFLQAIPVILGIGQEDLSTSILGSTVSKMSNGIASFQLVLKVTFSTINYDENVVSLDRKIVLSIEGQDTKSGQEMRSMIPVDLQQGSDMCPRGFILVPDAQSVVNVPAVCEGCKPGTYSISPLAHLSGSLIPSCLKCPAGCDCIEGGANIKCGPSSATWKVINGVYTLINCPAGYQLINSTTQTSMGTFSYDQQQCRECLVGQYIINPDIDSCQNCPPGQAWNGIRQL